MKKTLFIAAVLFAALAVSCEKKALEEPVVPSQSHIFTCVIDSPDSKVSIDEQGKTKWEPGDEILVNAGSGGNTRITVTLTANDISADGKTAKIDIGDLAPYIHSNTAIQSHYYAMYPASAVAPDPLYYNQAFSNTNEKLMAACNVGDTFHFFNLCGVIAFKVSGSYDKVAFSGNSEEVVGYDVYQARVRDDGDGPVVTYLKTADSYKTLTPSTKIEAPVVADGSTVNYLCFPVGANFVSGFTFKFYSGDELVKIATSIAPVNVPHGAFLDLGDITSHLKTYVAPSVSDHKSAITGATDLSSVQANCYVISAPGAYKLPVLKGSSDKEVGNVFGAEIVWETYNNADDVVAHSVIEAVDFDGPENFVYFKTPDTLKPGNAVIAAKDAQDRIIWSWHIWIPETAVTTVDATQICNAVLMDRNLGALVAASTGNAPVESYGLMYQWGRKDPFPGPKRVDSSTLATVAGTAHTLKDQSKTAYNSDDLVKGYMTVAETIQNPTVFGNVGGGDWDETKDGSRWSSTEKTIYDPCPAGYKVMNRESSTPLWNTTNIATALTDAGMLWASSLEEHWFSAKDGLNLVVFPLAGYIDDCDVNNVPYIEYPGKRAAVYSTYLSSGNPYHLNIREDKTDYHKASSTSASRGASVRCIVFTGE